MILKGLTFLVVILVVSGQQKNQGPKFKDIPIVSHENVLEVDGKFRYRYSADFVLEYVVEMRIFT